MKNTILILMIFIVGELAGQVFSPPIDDVCQGDPRCEALPIADRQGFIDAPNNDWYELSSASASTAIANTSATRYGPSNSSVNGSTIGTWINRTTAYKTAYTIPSGEWVLFARYKGYGNDVRLKAGSISNLVDIGPSISMPVSADRWFIYKGDFETSVNSQIAVYSDGAVSTAGASTTIRWSFNNTSNPGQDEPSAMVGFQIYTVPLKTW
jgi:hypothetical protein